jgi:hypothetical protein
VRSMMAKLWGLVLKHNEVFKWQFCSHLGKKRRRRQAKAFEKSIDNRETFTVIVGVEVKHGKSD